MKSTSDGTLATFDGPGRAIQCALAISRAVEGLGIGVRAGLDAGEIELRGTDVTGIAVVVSERVSALALRGAVLVSRTVRDLVAGSPIQFVSRGNQPIAWRGESEKTDPVFAGESEGKYVVRSSVCRCLAEHRSDWGAVAADAHLCGLVEDGRNCTRSQLGDRAES